MKAVSQTPLKRPRVLAVLRSFDSTAVLTAIKPLTALHQRGRISADLTLEYWPSRRAIERADVILFSRNIDPRSGYILESALALGKPVIYVLDDDLLSFDETFPQEAAQFTPEHRAQIIRYLTTASRVVVYSDLLAERVRLWNERVVRMEGPVDWSLVPSDPPRRHPGRVRIVYATGRVQFDPLYPVFLRSIRHLIRDYPEKVEVCLWGPRPPELLGEPSVRFLELEPDYDRYFTRFVREGFDIGLAPLLDDPFYRCKSNNKFREYGAARIAGIYSKVEVYECCVEDGQTGLLVSNEPDAWYRALVRLVEDEALRFRIQQQAFTFVREHYRLETRIGDWLNLVEQLTEEAARSGERVGEVQKPDMAPGLLPQSTRGRLLSFKVKRGLELFRREGLRAIHRPLRSYLNGFRLLYRAKFKLSRWAMCGREIGNDQAAVEALPVGPSDSGFPQDSMSGEGSGRSTACPQ